MTRTEYTTENGTRRNKDQRLDQIIQRIILTKNKHISQPQRILLDKTEQNLETRSFQAEIDRN